MDLAVSRFVVRDFGGATLSMRDRSLLQPCLETVGFEQSFAPDHRHLGLGRTGESRSDILAERAQILIGPTPQERLVKQLTDDQGVLHIRLSEK